MMEEKNVKNQQLSRQCENCRWGNCIYFKPNDYFCAKFKVKPSKVYFDGVQCPHFEQKR